MENSFTYSLKKQEVREMNILDKLTSSKKFKVKNRFKYEYYKNNV